MKSIWSRFRTFRGENRFLPLYLAAASLLAYGGRALWYTTSIDTEKILSSYDHILESWLISGRFGLVFTKWLFHLKPFLPWLALALLFLTCAAACLLLDFMIYDFGKGRSSWRYFYYIMPALYLTHPCFTEQYYFTLQCFEIAFGLFLAYLAVYLMMRCAAGEGSLPSALISLGLAVWSFGTYQGLLMPYVACAAMCFLVLYHTHPEIRAGDFWKIAFRAVGFFLASFLLYLGISRLAPALISGFEGESGYTSEMIQWGIQPASDCIRTILYCGKETVFGLTKFYTPILLVLVPAFFLYWLAQARQKRSGQSACLCAIIILFLSPFLLSFYLGGWAQVRTQMALPLVIGFGLGFLASIASENRQMRTRKPLLIGLLAVSLLTAFSQCHTSWQLCRAEKEKSVQEQAFTEELKQALDARAADPALPLVFIGTWQSSLPPGQIGETMGQSFYAWDSDSPIGSSERILGLWRTWEIAYPYPSAEQYRLAKEAAADMPAWPAEGSIRTADGYTIIKLSD
jgi:hypothetical protein